MPRLPYRNFTSPTCRSHSFTCLSFSVCAQGTASASLPKSQSCQAVKIREGKVQGVPAAHQGRMMLPSSFCRWLGQLPDLLTSGALDPSGSWGFGLPRADDFSLMLNSSAGKSTPEPPVKCNSQETGPAELQQHSAHTAQLQTLSGSSSSKSHLSLFLVLLP